MAQWREHLRGEHKQTQQQQQQQQHDDEDDESGTTTSECYDLPCGMAFIRRSTLFKFVPFCPTFLVDAKATGDDGELAGSERDVEGGAVVTVGVKRNKAL